MQKSRLSIAAFVAVLLLASGCQMARAGTRCRPGVSPARDATHVLFCQGGRWRKTLTIQQATQFVLATTAFRIEPEGGSTRNLVVNQRSESGASTASIRFILTSLNGTPLRDREVTLGVERPGGINGATATIVNGSTRTAPDGRVWLVIQANGIAGTYDVVASVAGVQKAGRITVTNLPGEPANIVMTGGTSQTAAAATQFAQPVSGRVFDRDGNAVSGVALRVSESPVDALIAPEVVVSDASGNFSFPVIAGPIVPVNPSLSRGIAQLEIRTVSNSALVRTVVLSVDAGPLDDAVVEGGGQSAPVTTSFAVPVVVTAIDEFGNGVAGASVQFTPIAGGTGASGFAPSPSGVTDAGGEFSRSITANGVAGSWTLRVTVTGVGSVDLVMTNTP